MKLLIFFLGLMISTRVYAESDAALIKALHDFHKNPAVEMDQLPPLIKNGRLVKRGPIKYRQIKTLIDERNNIREEIMNRAAKSFHVFAAPLANDNPVTIVDRGLINYNLLSLERFGLKSVELPIIPWTDSYWPTYKGLIAFRYADPMISESKVWLDHYNYYLMNRPEWVAANNPNILSPAEKYDLLVGDSNWSLSQFSWNEGKRHFDTDGVVLTWMGICHGWSGAAHMLAPIPKRAVVATAANGTKITFYQSDLKALNSMLWAYASPPTRFAGNRCKNENPLRSPTGRIVEQNCFDTNPATWHLSLTNQIGINKRSLVMDSTYDEEVWNYSIASYQYKYFNPQTLRPSEDVISAVVPINQFNIDKFRQFRNPATQHVIGVVMDVTHIKATIPHKGISSENATKTIRFIYDLELDDNYNIIGGEWYSNAHPDFIWTYENEAQALAIGDSLISSEATWHVDQRIPSSWLEPAQKSSQKGQPLYSVIKSLVEAGL